MCDGVVSVVKCSHCDTIRYGTDCNQIRDSSTCYCYTRILSIEIRLSLGMVLMHVLFCFPRLHVVSPLPREGPAEPQAVLVQGLPTKSLQSTSIHISHTMASRLNKQSF